MNSEAILSVQMQVKGLHALGNCYFPRIWLCCVLFQDVVHFGSYSRGVIILFSAIYKADV